MERKLTDRPKWCPRFDCTPLRGFQEKMCCGKLPEPEKHDGDLNTHRFCIEAEGVFNLQLNKNDAWLLRKTLEVVE